MPESGFLFLENGDEAMQPTNRKWLFSIIMIVIAIVPIALLIWYASMKLDVLAENYFLKYGLGTMSESDKEEIYALLSSQSPGMWDAIPEPSVGSILQRNVVKHQMKSTINSNNAGMRSVSPYVPKNNNTYRIVCLGDSLVYGFGGKEEDRFGNQMAEILEELEVAADGKKIEVYAVGLPGWNALNAASYMSSRISEYDPDLVLALMVENDLDDSQGVMGIGQLTTRFSPQHRNYGSSVFTADWPMFILKHRRAHNVLLFDLGPESRNRWEEAFGAWKRLETVLDERGGKMVFSVLYQPPFRAVEPPFRELCEYFYEQSGMKSPFIFTDFFGEALPHDPHPSRTGHRIIAVHYLHTLAGLGWLPINANDLPALDSRLDTATEHPPDMQVIRRKKEYYVKRLPERIDFGSLDDDISLGLLGGIYAGLDDEPLNQYPDASLKSVFVMRRGEKADKAVLEIEVPRFVELYPFTLEMQLNGQAPVKMILDDVEKAGRHRLESSIPKTGDFEYTIEVALRTDSYRTRIDDPTMRSYKLISAWQE
jgi:lysophospholipase L1-like esterase